MQRIPPEFVAKMSHDLKTPVGNAMMYAELLADDIRTLAEEQPELRDRLQDMEQYCDNIYLSSSKLINAIQSWGYAYQIEDGAFEINKTAVNLKDLLDEVIKRNSIFISGKSLNVSVDYKSDRDIYHTDYELIHLVMDNLMVLFVNMAGGGTSIRIEVSDNRDGLLFRFFVPGSVFNDKLIDTFASDISIRDRVVPDQGILKPGGYSLMFANMALKYIGAERGVDDEGTEPRSFWFQLPLS